MLIKIHVGFVLLLLAFLGTMASRGQDQNHNGYWWADRSKEFKVGFTSGYAMAMVNAYDRSALRCFADKNGGTVPEKYPGNEVLEACRGVVTPFDFNNFQFGQLADGVDEFYKDFRNKTIDIVPVMFYVRDQLKGRPAKELENELESMRRSSRSN
jgi:hypothetical protein